MTEWLPKAHKIISLVAPFFAYIMYDTEVIITEEGKAYTNGNTIVMPHDALDRWGFPGTVAVYLHELMHIAFFHVPRMRKVEYRFLWNIACDIVVNGYIREREYDNLKLPSNVVVDILLEHKSVEDIYAHLLKKAKEDNIDITSESITQGDVQEALGYPSNVSGIQEDMDYKNVATKEELKDKKSSVSKAINAMYGSLPGHLREAVQVSLREDVDWVDLLSAYFVKYADDYSYQVFDRRFEDFYLPDIYGEKVKGRVEIDTSGSISKKQLNIYLGNLFSLLQSFDNISLTVSLFHVKSYLEVHDVSDTSLLSNLKVQSGGTSFVDSLKKAEAEEVDFVIFLTDLYGEFPLNEPDCDVIWLSNGGNEAPFGQVIKLSPEEDHAS